MNLVNLGKNLKKNIIMNKAHKESKDVLNNKIEYIIKFR